MNNLMAEDISRIADLPYNWEKLRDKTILISGGTGFIGTFISNVIRDRNNKYNNDIKVISVSRHGGASDNTVEMLSHDITEPIRMPEKIDYIMHLASNTHPSQYASDPVGTITTNIIGCDNLLKLAVEKKVERFLLASSVEIYGQGSKTPMDESYCGYIDCNNARAGYNESKRCCEALCQSYKEQYGTDIVIARLARTFGPDRKKDSKAMAQFIDKAVNGQNIVLKSKGNQRYSYSYIADTASGIIKLLLDGKNGEAYNVSDDDEGMTLGDYAGYIAKISDTTLIQNIENDASASKATYALLDTGKLKNLGWQPQYTVKEGIQRTYAIYKGC